MHKYPLFSNSEINVRSEPGIDISDAVLEALNLSNNLKCHVKLTFNGTNISIAFDKNKSKDEQVERYVRRYYTVRQVDEAGSKEP